MIVEVDETVHSRKGIIKKPTTLDETRRDTVWIIGGIYNFDEKILYNTNYKPYY
jgi:hypothetical protein